MREDPAPATRPTPTADLVSTISTWYEEQTGLPRGKASGGRVLEILLYLERTGLGLGDVELHVVTDEIWHQRGNRDAREAQAAPIGRTAGAGKRPQYWFILPKAGGAS